MISAIERIEQEIAARVPATQIAERLSPEQVAIRRGVDGPAERTVRGRVTAVDFAGAVCTVAIAIEGPLHPLLLRCAGFDIPATDEIVGLAVGGLAHVLGTRVPA